MGTASSSRRRSLIPCLLALAGGEPASLSALHREKPNPLFAELNLSTNLLVLPLFGPRPQPIVAGVVSLGIATLVALRRRRYSAAW